MNLEKLNNIFKNEPGFRYKQVNELIYKRFISNWSEATNLPKILKEQLEVGVSLEIKADVFISNDKQTIKALFYLEDGREIEAVLMKHGERNTICVSSQVGCPLGCSFCATGEIGFKRNLKMNEIVDQVLFFARYLKNNYSEEKITNIVFMGMGEPFLNYENVIKAIEFMNKPEFFGLGARRFSISTIGITEGIRKLAGEKLEVNLAISFHASDDATRLKIIPVNKKYSISRVIKAMDYYIEKTNRKVMIEYLMLKGVNDSPEMANNLAKLLSGRLVVVNLISYNPHNDFESSDQDVIDNFKKILKEKRIEVTERFRQGRDIKAACGQLAANKNKQRL